MRGGKKCVCLAKGKRENSFLKLSPVLPRPCLLSKLWSWQQGSSHVPCFAPHPKHTLKPRAGRLHSCAGQSPRGSAGGLAAKSQRGWKQTGLLPVASANVSVQCEAQRPDLHNWLRKACFSPGSFLLLLLSLLKRAERACRVHMSCWYWKASWLLYRPFLCLVQHYFYFPANFPWATRSTVCWAHSKISANRP